MTKQELKNKIGATPYFNNIHELVKINKLIETIDEQKEILLLKSKIYDIIAETLAQ